MLNPSYKLKYLEQLVRVKTTGHMECYREDLYCIVCYANLRKIRMIDGKGTPSDVLAFQHAVRSVNENLLKYVELRRNIYAACRNCYLYPAVSVTSSGHVVHPQFSLQERLIEFYQRYV